MNRNKPVGRGPTAAVKALRIIVGTHAVHEALSHPDLQIEQFFVRDDLVNNSEYKTLFQKFPRLKEKTKPQKANQLDQITTSHQGSILTVRNRPVADWGKIFEKDKSIIVFLDGLEDPHNLGAILRTAWLIGVDAIICPENHSAKLTPAAHKVASGGAEHVPVEFVTSFADRVEELKKNDYWIFGLSALSKKNIFQFKYPAKLAWMIGSEEKGLRKTSENLCDELAQIPQASAGASYNASVAAGMALIETIRQLG